jgi:5-methylcytosine-specific restriction endonuclease McrA
MDGHIPKIQKLEPVEWRRARKRAIAALDHICAICGKYIDVELEAFNPLAVEVDHIVPRSRGGSLYDLGNLQLTHSQCNRKKGAKMAEDYADGKEYQNPVPLSNAW